MATTYTCPRCQTPIQAGQPACTTCALPLDPTSLAAFQADQARLGITPGPATPPTPRTSGWGCLGSIFDLIGGIFDLFN